MNYLVLVRHGQSRWNLKNKFTGWVDVPLSKAGINEALSTAKILEKWKIDFAFTSELQRAQETLLLILAHQDRTGIFLHQPGKHKDRWTVYSNRYSREDIPIYSSYLLNERYYGELQGMDKDEARNKFGEKIVSNWRRSYNIRPPDGESLEDVYNRVVPYFDEEVIGKLKKHQNVIVSAHGNTLRAIIKHIEKIDDENIARLEIPTGKPIIYGYSRDGLIKEDKRYSFNRPIYWEPA